MSTPGRVCHLGRQWRAVVHTEHLFQWRVLHRFHLPACCMGQGGRASATSSQVSTAEDNGILLYNGDNDHIAVELYQGHVRVSYDPGSYPSSAIYR